MFNQREYAARQRERYRAEGVCVYCGSCAVIHGRTYCIRCQNSHVASQRRMCDKRVAARLCATCGDAPLTEGYVTCPACREKARLYQRARKAGKAASGA